MKRIVYLLMVCMMAMAQQAMAQGKKAYTLEDVIPGGSNYFNLVPMNFPGLQWWGEVCVYPTVDNITTFDVKTGKSAVLVTLPEVNKALEGETPYKLSHPLKPLRTLQSATLPWSDKKIVAFRHNKYMVWYDFGQKKVVNLFYMPEEGVAGFDFCKANGYMAYTAGDNLYVAHQGDHSAMVNPARATGTESKWPASHDIVYGQSVHRNEFGITKGTFWSPKGTYLAFYRMDQSMVTDYPQVNTSTRIATLEPDKYPMAGMTSHKVTVGVYDVQHQKTVYLQAGDPTDRYFTNISWAPDEKSIYVIELNRDQNHAQLVRYDAVTGAKESVIYEETHPKYVEPQHPLVFLPWDDTKFIYQSQKSGYNHLYIYDLQNQSMTPLTQGEWVVQDILGFNAAKRQVIINSTEVSPLQSNVFAVDIKSGKRTLIGKRDGMHRAILSEKGTYVIDNVTSADIPREINILPTNGKAGVNLLTAEDRMKAEYNLPEISIGTIKAADGKTDLYYRLIKPVNFDASKKYPAIIYVYGGPHTQLIHNTRFYDARGWDLYMAQKGYVMLTVDNRGSDNRGLEFENCTFRHLGVEEMKDQMKGVDLLKSLPYVDADRIGVHGWSFGGFMTTNLMLTYPDTFKVGVAGGPVIDWKYYEVMYGERYMDTPQTNPQGYQGSDLKQKAKNLKGRLEIIIGGTDSTCVPQHTYTFLRACIDAGTHPDLFIYPEDGHNMVGHDRVHLHEHITRYFEDFLK